jgi:glutaredoxin 3
LKKPLEAPLLFLLTLEKTVQNVTMYTTAVCPYCVRAKQLLKSKGVTNVQEIRVDSQPDQLAHMMERTGRRTVPQIFIGSTHVGGCDDLIALDSKGELLPLLNT